MKTIEKKILVITTNGCIGCEVQRRNVHEAIKQVHHLGNITQENADWKKVSRTLLKQCTVKDYPTTIFLVDNQPRFRCEGSYYQYLFLNRFHHCYLYRLHHLNCQA